ncbi:MAG: response regulator transcription factor [Bulleidia sp.]|nr:response regulator transcription factor [Bulleidia sp.]
MIYCVEDDSSIREIEIYTLQSTGFEARGFETAGDFFKALQKEKPELVILDIMLPDMEGTEVLRQLKKDVSTKEIPVILASAKGTEYDKVKGLDTGADDYLAKPFGMMEMVSRVRAVLRRTQKPKSDVLEHNGIRIDHGKHEVTVNGKMIDLTLKEYEVLALLMSRPGIVFTRDQLLSKVWEEEYTTETRTVDVHIRTLRQKLQEEGAHIDTVRGVGYRYKEEL